MDVLDERAFRAQVNVDWALGTYYVVVFAGFGEPVDMLAAKAVEEG